MIKGAIALTRMKKTFEKQIGGFVGSFLYAEAISKDPKLEWKNKRRYIGQN
jgi:hypothetical protein